ncbi:helix-turn-helix domain-containing protein [Mucilaginibacter mali]|uniref:Helix-turn-helix domain-containing protein n=1 Tax=Mucilaginibacter mali TaxID=2740462 RepID=A0A7D4TX71_9SPHI|nr:helix-turn-helix domain-containing protein [Mucilaginibacter mali]QKJ32115.1 helix-turn-helix domain-containing protein [Mucilaginibacter mali]
MKHVSILVPMGHTSMPNIDGSHQILAQVNSFLADMGKPPLFDLHLVGLTSPVVQRNGLFTIEPDTLIEDVKKTDLIIIPAMHGDIAEALENNKAFSPWIVEQYNNGAEIASLCIGAFFLASTGLLTGKQAATHWSLAGLFRQMYPEVNLVDDKIMTEDDGIYTSGGAYSYLNLIVYLVEKFAGRDIAILISKSFMIDIDRISQSPFIIFQGQKAHEDEPVKKAQEFIENNFAEKITVDQLADMLALGRRSLERRFKHATSNTVTEYIQRVKIEAAKKSFESSRKNINEVMYDVGYTDTKAFRTIFKKVTGLSPVEYRNKYNKGLAA